MAHPQELVPPSYPSSPYGSDPSFLRAAEWLSSQIEGDADVSMIGVPLSRASLSGARCDHLPAAIRRSFWAYSTFGMGIDLSEIKASDVGDIQLGHPTIEEDLEAIRAVCAGLPAGPILAIGGDNSITSPVMIGRIGTGGGLLTIDAHHDLRDYKRDGISNGSPVRLLNDAGLDGSRIWQIGIRDFANSKTYSDYAQQIGITTVKAEVAKRDGVATYVRRALAELSSTDGIYVDIDVDSVERALAPGAPAALPGGLAPADLIEIAFMVGSHPRVMVCDIVEVDPERDVADATVRLAALVALSFMAGVASRGSL